MTLHRIIPLTLCLVMPLQSWAEGSYQTGLNQPMFDYPNRGFAQFIDVQQAGEVINISVCGGDDTDDLRVEIYDPAGNQVLDQTLQDANVSCTDDFSAPLGNPVRYVTTAADGIGAYEIRLDNINGGQLSRFDISITADAQTDPDPTAAAGRLWALQWGFNAGSYEEQAATDADYFPLVPGGRPGTNYVWKLDLNKFAGYVYVLRANDLGVDAPNSGYSVPTSGNSVTPKFPIYLNYPLVAHPRPTDPPVIDGFRFIDSDGQDHAISPGVTAGVQDSGVFEFTADTDGTYSIIIDSNLDGQFGAGDKLLLGNVTAGGLQQVPWDGTGPDGNTLPVGNYPARLQLRLGEYHFIAEDAETSGGNVDGLTIYLANSDGSVQDTRVYWDDATFLGGGTTLPDGALSSTPAGHHTWGDFTGDSIGNLAFIDTYVYGLTSASTALTAIADNDDPQPGVDAVLTAPAYSQPGDAVTIQVDDADSNILSTVIETVTVVVVNAATGEQEQLTLTETAADSGVFTADLATVAGSGAGTSNDGVMAVDYGQQLDVSFQDQPDAAGGSTERRASVAILDPDADDDGDGIINGDEGLGDLDGDGVADYLDLDVDNDGIPDAIETSGDNDGDGVADYRDLDSDNDGLFDVVESGGDVALDGDGDGRIDAQHAVGANGLADAVETAADSGSIAYNGGAPLDSDADTVFDFRDLDSDNDGLPDVIEAGGDDPDGDGVVGSGQPTVDADGVPVTGAGLTAPDTDGDGLPDPRDLDSDGDGVPDLVEAGGSDTDGDGRVDGFTDNDGDGFDDGIENNGLPVPDSDGDGIPDYRQNDDPDGDGLVNSVDLDDDNDGIPDQLEGDGAVDTDADGVADSLDLDSDNDGLYDLVESGADAATLDGDGDGVIDAANTVGSNGLADVVETAADSGVIAYNGGDLLDTDADTVKDFRDLDSDNDGLADVVEALGNDPDQNGQVGSGVPAVDGRGVPLSGAGLAAPDSDGDGVIDPRDRDSDGDGLMDLVEAGGDDGDNNGIVDGFTDADGDGWQDALSGAALPRPDGDGDGVADVLDLDSDNDGIADVLEAGGEDADGDGRVGDSPQQVDALGIELSAPLAQRDTDGDGVPDQRDLDADNDGIPDVIEAGGADPDGDGISGSGMPQVDAQGRVDPMLQPTDTDEDGMTDPYDLDADGDSLTDLVESGFPDVDADGMVDGFVDNDGDGYDDARSGTPLNLPDSDGDGLPDYRDSDDLDRDGLLDDDDLDDDNDGIPDALEGDDAVDTDGDGVPDSRDLDSDNDGLFDLAESGADAATLDSDGNGRIDGSHPVGANGLADVVETAADSGQIGYNGGVLLDTDGDMVKDFRDLDSDNDGIADVIENGGTDGDGNGQLGTGVPAVDNNGVAAGGRQPPLDTDGDGQPDARDLDADGDGSDDILEAGGSDADGDGRVDGFADSNGDGWNDASAANTPRDSDYDGVPDFQDTSDDRGQVETALNGIGALQWLLLPLLLLWLLRLKPLGRHSGLGLLALALVLPSARVDADWRNSDDWTWYLGGGLGLSKMDPRTRGTIYSVDDDRDSSLRLFVGADLTPSFSAELAFADLGTTTLEPEGDIDYSTLSLDLLYYFHDQDEADHVGWAAYVKAGLGYIDNSASVPYDKQTSAQIALGIGGEYAWESGWALRADLESYDRDAAALTLDLLYRFGERRQQRPEKRQPAPVGPVDSDGDGVFDARDRCPQTPMGTEVDDLGCAAVAAPPPPPEPEAPSDRDGDGVIDAEDQCPDTLAGARVNARGCALFETRIEGVYFELGSARLTRDSKRVLDQVVEVLQQFPQLRIEVQAHTDSLGRAESNQKLSEARARSVMEYLTSKGIDAGRLEARGYGESRPVASNDTPEGRARNRRVEFRVIEGG